jgi:glucose-6-phosphate isomerase
MKIKNNLKLLKVTSQKNINYSIDDFFKIDLFNPITQKNYFSQYDFSILKKKKYRVHVFGMGGSSLSAKLLMQFMAPEKINSKLFIYDNPSPIQLDSNLSKIKISKDDLFIFISKSGNTVETKFFLHWIIKYLKKKNIKNIFKHFLFITENKNNYLNNFALKNKIKTFEHDPNIGGRFSIFSITALLPIIALGYSLDKLLNSFKKAKSQILKNHAKLANNISFSQNYEKNNNLNIVIGLNYHDKLRVLNEWYRQIFAESLGKNKEAINYISAFGSIDQHSQFQLFIDGPRDKQFIFFMINNPTKPIKSIKDLLTNHNLLSTLEKGAIKTLELEKYLVNQLIIDENFDDYSYLLIYLIFDIYLRAKIEKINFLDQPAVEVLKKNTRA